MRHPTRRLRRWTLIAGAGVLGLAACVPPSRIGLGVVYVDEAPPPARVEVISAPPGREFVWIAGYWTWNDEYVWMPGHWAHPPRRNLHWAPGRWHRGKHHQWYWEPGHWR